MREFAGAVAMATKHTIPANTAQDILARLRAEARAGEAHTGQPQAQDADEGARLDAAE